MKYWGFILQTGFSKTRSLGVLVAFALPLQYLPTPSFHHLADLSHSIGFFIDFSQNNMENTQRRFATASSPLCCECRPEPVLKLLATLESSPGSGPEVPAHKIGYVPLIPAFVICLDYGDHLLCNLSSFSLFFCVPSPRLQSEGPF